jgi:glycosyltransferase involved in cell wall biosynthesis
MHKNKLSLAIVIPAYNEERHLAACLESIAAQTVPPDEVIVVDNNSTDSTAAVAKKYPFVTLITEAKQGLIPARNAGFNKAKSTLLARINTDVTLAPDWIAHVLYDFSNNEIAGLTGPAQTKLLPSLSLWHTTIWSKIYFLMSDAFFKVTVLWGANMVITAEVWQQIRPKAHLDDKVVHEDQDLSLLLAASGGKSMRDNRLIVRTEEQSYQYWPKLKEYLLRRWHTKRLHQQIGTYLSPDMVTISVVRGICYTVVALPLSLLFVVYSFCAYGVIRFYHLFLRSRI